MYALMNKVWTAKANLAKKKKKGFTLIEMIVVMAIIAILAAILIPMLSKYMTDATQTTGSSTARSGYTAAAAWASSKMRAGAIVAADGDDGNTYKITVDGVDKTCILVRAVAAKGSTAASGKLVDYFSNLTVGTVNAYVEVGTGATMYCEYDNGGAKYYYPSNMNATKP